jgi:hypothetical protein
MRRLFLYLLIHVLPKITEYIINKYFFNKSDIEIENELKIYPLSIDAITRLIFNTYTNPNVFDSNNSNNLKISLEESTNPLYYLELHYFLLISIYIKDIDISKLVDEIAKMYGTSPDIKTKIIDGYTLARKQEIKKTDTSFKPLYQCINESRQVVQKANIAQQRVEEPYSYTSVTGSVAMNIAISPLLLTGFILCMIYLAINKIIIMIQNENNKSRIHTGW